MLQRFDDILAEILQPLDLHSLLFERLIKPGIFDGDGDISGDGGEQFEVVAREVIAIDRLAQAEHGGRAVVEAAGDEIVQVELFDRAAHGFGLVRCGARRFEKQAAALERRPRGIEKAQIERAFGPKTHRARKHELAGMRRIFEENGQAIHQQRLRNAVEHRAEQRLEAHFVRERAPEFNQRAAIVQPVAVEEMIEARLHPIAQRLEQKCRDHDGDHGAGGPGRSSAVWNSSPISAMAAK